MALKKYKPTSPGRRFMTVSSFEEVTKREPEKSLTEPLKKTGGRNNNGRITTRRLARLSSPETVQASKRATFGTRDFYFLTSGALADRWGMRRRDGRTELLGEADVVVLDLVADGLRQHPGLQRHPGGGRVVAIGKPDEVMQHPDSLTGQYLTGLRQIEVPRQRRQVLAILWMSSSENTRSTRLISGLQLELSRDEHDGFVTNSVVVLLAHRAEGTEALIEGTAVGATASHTYTGLTPSTAYEFQVVAYRGTTFEDAVIGESLAGLFIVETYLREPALFDRYAAVSPSLWWDGQALSREAVALLDTVFGVAAIAAHVPLTDCTRWARLWIWMSNNPDDEVSARDRIRAQGHAFLLEHHTFENRLHNLLTGEPWQNPLEAASRTQRLAPSQ